MERQAFLKTLRNRLSTANASSESHCPRYTPLAPPFGNTREELTRVFLDRQVGLGVSAKVVGARSDAHAAVERLLADKGWSIVCSPRVSSPGLADRRVMRASDADFGLVEAWLAVAETGSIVIRTGDGERRDTSLLPPAVGFLLPESRIVARIGDVLRRVSANRWAVPTCLTLITGPSASADIVGVRTIGVHGPGEVYAWLLQGE